MPEPRAPVTRRSRAAPVPGRAAHGGGAFPELRSGIVETCREMNRIGLNQGTSGNLSHRIPDGLLITPTSLPYDRMRAGDIVAMGFDGSYDGPYRPSSEWRFHRDILKNRPDANVVLHTHSIYATTLAVHERAIPAFHYMVAVAGGAEIRCAPYACFGTQDLSDHALDALRDRTACLLGHHGLIVLADTFERALWRAVEVETLAKMYVHALAIGEPRRLQRDRDGAGHRADPPHELRRGTGSRRRGRQPAGEAEATAARRSARATVSVPVRPEPAAGPVIGGPDYAPLTEADVPAFLARIPAATRCSARRRRPGPCGRSETATSTSSSSSRARPAVSS